MEASKSSYCLAWLAWENNTSPGNEYCGKTVWELPPVSMATVGNTVSIFPMGMLVLIMY